jgi:hypothetical protein
VSVESASEYKCIILPVDEAESAAQLSLDHSFRVPNRNGSKKKPGKLWAHVDYIAKVRDKSRLPALNAEQAILKKYIDNWDIDLI